MAVTAQARAPQVEPHRRTEAADGDRLTTAHAVREQHGQGYSYHEPHLPDAVVFAESAGGSAGGRPALRPAQDPRSSVRTGTSLEGHISARTAASPSISAG